MLDWHVSCLTVCQIQGGVLFCNGILICLLSSSLQPMLAIHLLSEYIISQLYLPFELQLLTICFDQVLFASLSQLWDVRRAIAPLKEFVGHTEGLFHLFKSCTSVCYMFKCIMLYLGPIYIRGCIIWFLNMLCNVHCLHCILEFFFCTKLCTEEVDLYPSFSAEGPNVYLIMINLLCLCWALHLKDYSFELCCFCVSDRIPAVLGTSDPNLHMLCDHMILDHLTGSEIDCAFFLKVDSTTVSIRASLIVDWIMYISYSWVTYAATILFLICCYAGITYSCPLTINWPCIMI